MMSDRLPLLPGWISSRKATSKEFYEVSLKAIRKRRGLVHGAFSQGSKVCAVGAVHTMLSQQQTSFSIDMDYVEALQKENDAYPRASATERRQKVIAWLQAQIKRS